MKPLRILILEDEPLVALDLESMVAAAAPSEVEWSSSVATARKIVASPIDFALLDIDVEDGKTFDFARFLHQSGTPFAFVSGSRLDDIPPELRHATFIPKPYRPRDIARIIGERAAARAVATSDDA